MKLLVLLVCLLLPTLAHAQVIVGPARAVDGDTLDMTGHRIRLHGIDALEAEQTCDRGGTAWACGKDATATLATLVSSGPVECAQREVDLYGRSVATCRVGDLDLGQAMVDAGLAVVLPNAPPEYQESEARRRHLKFGIWGTVFELPSAYRASNPQERPQAAVPNKSTAYSPVRPRGRSRPSGVFYGSCAAARAAGAAPLYAGEPGYRPEMDGDGDGVACEPYRGRR